MLDSRSEARLVGVHPRLAAVVRRAADAYGVTFIVTEGLRTRERQRVLVDRGASQTMQSRHLTGHAVDLAPTIDGEVRWDWPLFYPLAEAMKAASQALGDVVIWGGAWRPLKDIGSPINHQCLSRTFPDGSHFEVRPEDYPFPHTDRS